MELWGKPHTQSLLSSPLHSASDSESFWNIVLGWEIAGEQCELL